MDTKVIGDLNKSNLHRTGGKCGLGEEAAFKEGTQWSIVHEGE